MDYQAAPERATETHTERTERQEDIKETGRLEAFSDGVFAIAITLLILNIQVPGPLSPDLRAALGQFARLWPLYLAYVLSFVTILIMWANHHLVFRLISHTNQLFLMLNGLLLMSITFLNFPTALLADSLQHGGAEAGALIYNGTLIVISTLFNIVWRYAIYKGRLLDRNADRALVLTIDRQYRFGPVIYLIPFAAAFLTAGLSIGIDLALAVFFALTGSIHFVRKRNGDLESTETPALPR